jgi:hypothetical protein
MPMQQPRMPFLRQQASVLPLIATKPVPQGVLVVEQSHRRDLLMGVGVLAAFVGVMVLFMLGIMLYFLIFFGVAAALGAMLQGRWENVAHWAEMVRDNVSGTATIAGYVLLAFGAYAIVVLWRTELTATRAEPGELLVARWPLRLGQREQVRVRRKLRNLRVTRATATLVCEERASSGSGEADKIHVETVYTAPLPVSLVVAQKDYVELLTSLTIPQTGPPSFTTYNNSISWSLVVRLEVASFLPLESHFPILVLPEVLP